MLVCEFCRYINSCGLGGEIPSTFANLQNMQIVLRGHHCSIFVDKNFIAWAQLNIDMLGFQVGIRHSFHWQDTRFHWKLDKAKNSVSYQSFWYHLQMHFTWMMSFSSLKIFMHSSKAEKYGYYNTTVKMLVQCFVGEFKETLLKVQYHPVFLTWPHWPICEYIFSKLL